MPASSPAIKEKRLKKAKTSPSGSRKKRTGGGGDKIPSLVIKNDTAQNGLFPPGAIQNLTQSSASKIELLELLTLKPIPTNPRQHSPQNVLKIARSIQTYGWTTPVLITDALEVIAGHGRLLAAKQLGQTHIPCIRLSHLTPQLVESYRIADNRLALDSEWDQELLTEAIRWLSADPGFDLELTGFDKSEIEDFLFIPGTGLTDEDDVPEPAAEVVAALGDIWQLGDHRLMCADSTSSAAVSRLLEGKMPMIMVTDPPYGVDYDPKWRDLANLQFSAKRTQYMSLGDSHRGTRITGDHKSDWSDAFAIILPPVVYVWHAAVHVKAVVLGLERLGYEMRAQLIWVKEHAAISRGHYSYQHEPCLYAVMKGKTANWHGEVYASTVIKAKMVKPNSGEDFVSDHGCQKPVECMRRPILNHTRPGELCYDPFMGSGTTLIAAQSARRWAYGLEINPAYVDVAIRRWEAYTGNVARLAASLDGAPEKTFQEVAQWRKKPNGQKP